MLAIATKASVALVQKYLPSPFIFSLILTFIALLLTMMVMGLSPMEVLNAWGDGLWKLLTFTMQMALVLATGSALASAPPISRLLNYLARKVTTPSKAIVVVTLVALVGCWLNWGFGLIIGAIMAKTLAKHVKGVDYPLLVASAYSGFLIWHGGLSGSVPLAVATQGEALTKLSGGVLTQAIPIGETLFAPYNLAIIALLVIGLPLLNRAMHPKTNPTTIDPRLIHDESLPQLAHDTPAQRLDDSKIVGLLLAVVGFVYLGAYFMHHGFNLTLNIVITLFLFFGIATHLTPERYMRAITINMEGVGGIVLLFPFYAGIMGIMAATNSQGVSLAGNISDWFAAHASEHTLPLYSFLSAGIVNVFIPSGGGQWAVQGPVMMPAGQALGVSPSVMAMSIAWGDAWTNMIQPFWALPLLGIAGLNARAIMGYCLMTLIYSGVVICGCFYFLT